MRKVRVKELRPTAMLLYKTLNVAEKGRTFKNFFKYFKRNYLNQGK